MKSPRLPLAGLICLIGFAGISFAALGSGSETWLQVTYTITLIILLFAAIAARFLGPFWHGFAVVGWGYFLLGIGPWFNSIAGGSLYSVYATANINLPTSVWLVRVSDAVVPNLPVTPATINLSNNRIARVAYTVVIAHSLLTLLLACCGGLVARAVAAHAGASSRAFRV